MNLRNGAEEESQKDMAYFQSGTLWIRVCRRFDSSILAHPVPFSEKASKITLFIRRFLLFQTIYDMVYELLLSNKGRLYYGTI